MRRILLIACVLASTIASSIADDHNARLASLRTIGKQPKYQSTPQYALLTFGPEQDQRVWLVEDGRTLYVDRNGNGDLTDDGPPVQPSEERKMNINGHPSYDFNYKLDDITPAEGARHTDFDLRRWNYGEGEEYGLSLTVNGATPMYSGWNAFFAAKPEDAPIMPFGAPLQPRLLRYREFVIGAKEERFSICFYNPGHGEGAHTRLSIDALPPQIVPVAIIDWPVADGSPPLRTKHSLTERCCYWEFYTTDFQTPKNIIEGTATVTIELPAGTVLDIATNKVQAPVKTKK